MLSAIYDRIAPFYDETRSIPREALVKLDAIINEEFKNFENLKFLELGAGTGRVGEYFIRKGCDYTAVDISKNMLKILKSKLPAVHNAKVIHGDALIIDFPNKYDVIITAHSIHMFGSILDSLTKVNSLLTPKGIYINCLDELSTCHKRFSEQWSLITSTLNDTINSSRYDMKFNDLTFVLKRNNIKYLQRVLHEWNSTITVKELLSAYQNKAYPSCWRIKNTTFSRALQELTEWARREYGSLAYRLTTKSKMEILIVGSFEKSLS